MQPRGLGKTKQMLLRERLLEEFDYKNYRNTSVYIKIDLYLSEL
tara:strand:- start:387 stop:518 length:132 start_codon:yes stop_codon:yes gene_type:complete